MVCFHFISQESMTSAEISQQLNLTSIKDHDWHIQVGDHLYECRIQHLLIKCHQVNFIDGNYSANPAGQDVKQNTENSFTCKKHRSYDVI